MKVHVEYCGGWGYESRYSKLRQNILAALPDADIDITGDSGRSTSFEITVDDKLIFSKLSLGGFPDSDHVVAEIQKALKNEEPSIITESQPAGCIIL